MQVKHPQVVVLLGYCGANGVWRFLFGHGHYMGFPLYVDGKAESIAHQVSAALMAMQILDDSRNIELRGRIEPLLAWEDGGQSLLLVAELKGGEPKAGEWIVLPEILRRMPKGRNRVGFMKVFQLLSTNPDDESFAVELTPEAIAEWFPEEV